MLGVKKSVCYFIIYWFLYFVDPVIAASVYVSSFAPGFVNSEHLVILASSTHCGFYNPSDSFSFGFPELRGERFDGDFQFRLCFHKMSGCGSLHLFPSAAEETLWWWKDKALIYNYATISLEIISLC